jgi:hypothetical protein
VQDIGACSQCSRPLTGAQILYTAQGAMICTQCQVAGEVKQSVSKAAGTIRNAAMSCLALAFVALLINPYFLVTIGSVSVGTYAIRNLLRKDQFSNQLSRDRAILIGVACFGLLIDLVSTSIILVGLFARLQ